MRLKWPTADLDRPQSFFGGPSSIHRIEKRNNMFVEVERAYIFQPLSNNNKNMFIKLVTALQCQRCLLIIANKKFPSATGKPSRARCITNCSPANGSTEEDFL